MSEEKSANQLALSSVESKKSSFLWRIANFSRLERKLNRLVSAYHYSQIVEIGSVTRIVNVFESPVFSVNPDDLKWSLVMLSIIDQDLCPDLDFEHPPRFLCFEFRSKDPRFFSTDVNVKISLTTNNGEKVSFTGSFCIQRSELEDPSNDGIVYTFKNINWFMRNCCLKNDELQLLCEYELIPDDKTNQTPAFRNSDQVFTLDKKLEKLWDSKEFCDFKLIAPCGRRLSAHKLILSAKSPVFFAMLKNEMKEKKNDSVFVKDISYEALEKMLRFMYSGKVDKLDYESIDGLLNAAEKYEVTDLKDICKAFLLKNLSTSNALKSLKLCNLYHITDLKSFVESFVKSNAKEVFHQSAIQNGNETDTYLAAIQHLVEMN